MLTLSDIPEWLERLDGESRALASALRKRFESFARPQIIPAGTQLADDIRGQVAYVLDGSLRYTRDDRLIRFFNEDDVLYRLLPDAELTTEFSTTLLLCTPRELRHVIATDPRFAHSWTQYRESQLDLMNGLCSVQAPTQRRIKPEIRMYSEGDAIIRAGTPSKEIYVMISGTAAVIHEEMEIGTINCNEIFGEIGFLIGSPRAATVEARDECMVQVVRGEEFKDLMSSRPNIALQLATTQARRIAGLNERILEGDSSARC